MTAKEYFEQMCKDAGLGESETAALIAASNNPKFASSVEGLLKKQSDYDAQVGRVNKLTQDVQSWNEWANGNAAANKPGAIAEYNRMLAAYNEATTKLAAMQAAMGGTGGTGAAAVDGGGGGEPKYVTIADLTKFTQDLDTRWSSALKASNTITARHIRNFNEDPDFDAINKIAKEKGWDGQPDGLERAYQAWIEPRAKEREAAAAEKWKTDTRAEIERDLRSRLHVPAETAPIDYSPVFQTQSDKPLTGAALDEALVQEFVGAGKK